MAVRKTTNGAPVAPAKPGLKQCFMIGPFGSEDSDVRKWSDALLADVIRPLADEFGYEAHRAIDDERQRDINIDMVGKLLTADLVIADLTNANANVYYELAVRHAIERPFIQIIQKGQRPPFDIQNLNVRPLPTRQRGSVVLPDPKPCIKILRSYFEAVRDNTGVYDSPLSGRGAGRSLLRALNVYEAKRTVWDKDWLNKFSQLPGSITSAIIKYAVQAPMYYRNFDYDIVLTHADGYVTYDMTVSFELVNVSDNPQTITSRYPKLSRAATLKKVEVDGHRIKIDDPALYGADAITVAHVIQPGRSKSIKVRMVKTFAEQDSDLFTAYSHPSLNFKFRVRNKSPRTLKYWVEMLNSQGTPTRHKGNSSTWKAERPLLPNQGIRLLWRPSDDKDIHREAKRVEKGSKRRRKGAA